MIRAAKILTLTAALPGALATASGCGKAVDETDSESHFLTFCTDECSDGLSCVCGVCTRPCEDDSACQSVAFGARCAPLALSSCAATSGELACDVECSTDSDCGGVSGTHECLSGRCRARQDGLSSRVELDAGIPTAAELSIEPIVWPTPDENCCLGTGMFWPGYRVDDDCTFTRGGDPLALCESELPTTCNDPLRVDGADIIAALQHPDVASRIEEDLRDPPSYVDRLTYGWDGADPATLPGSVGAWAFTVEYWPHTCSEIVNGNRAPDDCVDMPEGVRQFVELMDTLLMQQLSLGTCAPDLRCYQPVSIGACDAGRIGATYDVESSQCMAGPLCALDGNSFESPLACDQACSNDPCAFGDAITDQACSGVSTRLLASPLSPRCFSNATRACICACAQTGAALDSCIVQQGALPEAVCGP